jgi:hypothetical protein
VLDLKPFFMKDFNIFNIEISSEKIYLYVISTKTTSICTLCYKTSKRIHSRYYRKLKDLPILRYSLEIMMICRKFFCDNLCCNRKVLLKDFQLSSSHTVEELID